MGRAHPAGEGSGGGRTQGAPLVRLRQAPGRQRGQLSGAHGRSVSDLPATLGGRAGTRLRPAPAAQGAGRGRHRRRGVVPQSPGRHVLRVGRPGVRAGRSAGLQRRPGGMDQGQRPLLPGNHHSVPERPHDHPARDRTGHHGRSPGHQPARRDPRLVAPPHRSLLGSGVGRVPEPGSASAFPRPPAASWRAGPPASGAATLRGRPTRP